MIVNADDWTGVWMDGWMDGWVDSVSTF